MELNKRNLILFCLIILVIIILFFIIKSKRSRESYATEINGTVQLLRFVGRGEGYVEVKFEGESKFNPLCVIYIGSENQNDLKIGDSIHKSKNSGDYQIYRQDRTGNYSFYKTLKNKP